MPRKVETALVEGEPVRVSAMDVVLLGSPSLVTLKPDTPGPTIRVRILRACGEWVEDDEPDVNDEYGRGLIENGLAQFADN